MKIRIIISILSIILASCCSDSDFIFSKKYRNLINKYSIGDTIYFQNSIGDLDTILISNFDSMQVCSFITNDHKYVSVEIKHLPINHWNGGGVIEKGKETFYDQELISVDKQLKNENDLEHYLVEINFRDFHGEIINLDQIQTDSLILGLGIKSYWVVTNKMHTDRGDSTIIDKIIWTEKHGLTGYYKRNGDFYKITKH